MLQHDDVETKLFSLQQQLLTEGGRLRIKRTGFEPVYFSACSIQGREIKALRNNNVRLIYNTNTSAVLPLPGSPSVAVVMFNDERTRQYIGERKDGSVFTASSTIADWFSRSLADELGRQGVQVSFASTLEQARAANPTYIVTGTITDVWLQEQSATRVQCTIKAKVALSNKKGVLYSENLSSTQERQFIPSASAIESLLSDTLKDLLVPAAKKIQSQIH